MIYLATKYSDPDKAIRNSRFWIVSQVAGGLMRRGFLVFSPISHTHPIAEQCDLPKGFEYWERYDRVMLTMCNCMMVLEDWKDSIGVRKEIDIAKELGIPIAEISIFPGGWPEKNEDEVEFCKQHTLVEG